MRTSVIALVIAVAASQAIGARDQAGKKPPVTLDKAAVAGQLNNDSRQPMVPEAGQTFLWVSGTISVQQTVDLTKVALTSGTASYPLVGVDSAWGGDPKEFSMIAPVRIKGRNGLQDPLELTRSIGTIGFAFTPGKLAQLKVIGPPQSFCLLFAVPQAVRSGQVKGLSAAALPIPAIAATK